MIQDTPPLDVERVSQTLKEKNVQPSTLKFGFLGLGIMGSGMVKNLLNSGHKVIVWNRTSEKVPYHNMFISSLENQVFVRLELGCRVKMYFSLYF